MTRMIEVQGLRKAYGGQVAVDGISFTVSEKEIFGLLGPNGAGKTTTVECMSGLRRRDEGVVSVAGWDPLHDRDEIRRHVGVQLQSSQIPARLRVGEALELYASFYPAPLDPDELLDAFGLTADHGTAYGALSGGQRQRLSIALALVGDPRVAILDELTTGLDPAARRHTWDVIESVRDRGVTVVLVTHFMPEAERLCDRVAVVDHGRVIALDTPAGLADAAGGEERLRFTPSAPLDPRLLLDLPEVTSVEQRNGQVLVTGRQDTIAAVTAVLARHKIVAHGLRVEQESLDDAFIALTSGEPARAGERRRA